MKYPSWKSERYTQAKWTLTNTLLLLLFMAVVVDIGWHIFAATRESGNDHVIVPREFVYRYPDCAQKLIETADIDNVRIVSPENYSSRGGYVREDAGPNSSQPSTLADIYVPSP